MLTVSRTPGCPACPPPQVATDAVGPAGHPPSLCTRMAEAVMSVVTLKYGSHRSYEDKDQGWGGAGPRRTGAGRGGGGGLRTSICLSWKTRWTLRLKADPVNMEVAGYVRSSMGSSTEVML